MKGDPNTLKKNQPNRTEIKLLNRTALQKLVNDKVGICLKEMKSSEACSSFCNGWFELNPYFTLL